MIDGPSLLSTQRLGFGMVASLRCVNYFSLERSQTMPNQPSRRTWQWYIMNNHEFSPDRLCTQEAGRSPNLWLPWNTSFCRKYKISPPKVLDRHLHRLDLEDCSHRRKDDFHNMPAQTQPWTDGIQCPGQNLYTQTEDTFWRLLCDLCTQDTVQLRVTAFPCNACMMVWSP